MSFTIRALLGAPSIAACLWLGHVTGGLAQAQAQTQEAPAADLPLTSWVNHSAKEGTCERNPDEKVTGDGQKITISHNFTLHVENTGFDDMAGIDAKIYVAGYVIDENGKKGTDTVFQVLEKKDISLAAVTSQDVDMGKVDLEQIQHVNATSGNKVSYGGSFYKGFVLQVYVGDKLIKTFSNGTNATPSDK